MGFFFVSFFIMVSIAALWFCRNKKYYQRTVQTHGEKHASDLFKKIERGGYILLALAMI